ncbi:MAG: flagellar brake protein [Gammaproteobacteria bacterium]|nr:flagellar brake protein [Gammaproteobacteria bacterium]MBU1775749.1 flagellar brake protein [Gammaproteobacteria bacterium]
MSVPATPEKRTPPENLLFRSHLEICRIMQHLAQEHSPVTAEIGSGHVFKSFILSADAASGHFTVAYCIHKQTNSMLLDSPLVEFTATDRQSLHYTFDATEPEEIQLDGQPAIQFVMPVTLLLHNRRDHPRIPVPADVSLRCVADEGGFMPFESHVTDISHEGLGCLIYDPAINLEAGAILHGNRVILPNGNAVVADLELRYVTTNTQADGSVVNRAGFRFVQKPAEIRDLVGYFIQDLDKKAG